MTTIQVKTTVIRVLKFDTANFLVTFGGFISAKVNLFVTHIKNIEIKTQKKSAGGLDAVISSAKHLIGEVGLLQGTNVLKQLNQFDGFDCPGCAWPDPDHERSAVEFCENGVKAIAEEATEKKCGLEFFAGHSIKEMKAWTDYEIGKSGRIVQPMMVKSGSQHYEPIEWKDAFALIGNKLKSLPSPNEAVFYTSGRTSNEAAFLYQLFVRMYGTNNLPDCSNMCHESSGVALIETVGIGKGTVTLDDFDKAEVIVVIGQNPGTNHPRMLTTLQQAKKKGAIIITINPIEEAGLISFQHPRNPLEWIAPPTKLTDLWLPVRINEDVALLKAINKILLSKEKERQGQVLDLDFIKEKTVGFEAWAKDLEESDLEKLIAKSGVESSKVLEAAEILATKKRIIVCWAMGLTQHKNAVDNIREIVNLLLMKGSIGKPGTGTCPVRGHSNVQGDRTMGIYEKPKKEFLDCLQSVFGFDPPREAGYDTVDSIRAMHERRAKVFIAMGGNFLSATPDTNFTEMALESCDLTVHVSTKLNRSHLAHGKVGLILPCLGRTEEDKQNDKFQFVTVENSAGVVHQSRGTKTPASDQLLSEPRIVSSLAMATLKNTTLDWNGLADNYELIRELIERTIPGFEHFNERVRRPGGFYLINAAREGSFNTPSTKAHFTINQLAEHNLAEDEFLMMTIRSHDQFNTTIYGLDDRYRGIENGRRVVFINETDAEKFNFKKGDLVNLVSQYDDVERRAEGFVIVPYQIPARCIATYFPEANVLIPHNHFARGSQTPISKSVVVKLEKV
jgi:molybdopterin-dependent oxidoreductase alpha subunit